MNNHRLKRKKNLIDHWWIYLTKCIIIRDWQIKKTNYMSEENQWEENKQVNGQRNKIGWKSDKN